MIQRTAEEIARLTGGELAAGSPAAVATRAVIDSRRVQSGDVFFAIRGPRFDGHEFAAEAIARGARIVVADRPLSSQILASHPAAAIVRTGDTTRALGDLARDERIRRGLRVVAITGSAGKTTAREMTRAVLATRYPTAASPGNFNNQWGLPLSILGLDAGARVAVLEAGMNHAGELTELARIARPDVAVVTNVGDAHLGHFEGPAEVARAKLELVDALDAGGVAFLHAGSPALVDQAGERAGIDLRWFGTGSGGDLEPREVAGDPLAGFRFRLGAHRFRLAAGGVHLVELAAAAVGVARLLDVPDADAARALASFAPLPGRGRVIRLGDGSALIDESYNASPAALRAALDTADAAAWTGRIVAVLGDMLELGTHAVALHREIGARLARARIGAIYWVGEFAGAVAGAYRDAGGAAPFTSHASAAAAADAVTADHRAGDLVLVKGSRGVGLDAVVDALARCGRASERNGEAG